MSCLKGGITRRMFLKGSAASLALAGSSLPPFAALGRSSVLKPDPVLSLTENGDYIKATFEAVENLGGMTSFVPRDSEVLIKPNIGWDRTVQQGANTHPLVVKAVIVMCLEAGARRVIVVDRTCNDARRSYNNSGIAGMVNALGDRRVRLDFVRPGLFKKTPFPDGKTLREWPLYEPAVNADVLINIPVAKHHSISKLTLSMKNLMGLLGGNRGVFHSGIGQKLADLTSALKPDLHILDATRILLRNGPSGGRLEDVKVLNRIAASPDPVLLDAYGTTLFGLSPSDIPSVSAGFRHGLGEMDLARARVLGGAV